MPVQTRRQARGESNPNLSTKMAAASTLTQRVPGLLSFLVQISSVVLYAYIIHFQLIVVDIPADVAPTRSSFGGPAKYLTFLNLWGQLAYYVLAVLTTLTGESFSGRYEDSSRIQRIRDYVYATLTFPIGVAVVVLFWGIWAVDRELVMPARFDKWISPFHNHLLHSSMVPLLLFVSITTFHIYPRRRNGMAVTGAAMVAYMTWISVIAYLGGFWVYPILRKFDFNQRAGFFAICGVLGALLYIIGEAWNSLVWRGVSTQSRKKVS